MTRETVDAVVVGAGPNGLAAAVALARAGLEVIVLEAAETVGGGARTEDLGLAEGIGHDVCSAVHPLALASPFFAEFDLRARGVELVAPDVSFAQVLDGGRAAVAYRDLERTVAGLGADRRGAGRGDAGGRLWHDLVAPLVDRLDGLVGLAMGDRRSVPSAAQVDAAAALGSAVLRAMRAVSPRGTASGPAGDALALLAGAAAHTIAPIGRPSALGPGLLLAALGHGAGWPIPRGGSTAIADALAADLVAHGGRLRTGEPVRSWRQLPRARAYLMDLAPGQIARIWSSRLPTLTARRLTRYRHGNAAAKVDLVLSGPVPWRAPGAGGAATVHVGGDWQEVARAEAEVAAGRHAERPVTLVSDPAATDPSREVGGLRPLWTYAHVPAGSTRDVTEDVVAQLERHAPGVRDLVVASRCRTAADAPRENPNLVGGDIAGGRVTAAGLLLRPGLVPDPYDCGIPGVYLCSASAPPGPGVHGMSGWHAARRALRHRFGTKTPPSVAPDR